jgi:Uma2 family endonuclease
MSTILKLTANEYDSMIEKGAFNGLQRRIELIRGELRERNPAGPVHEDYIDFLNRWSVSSTEASECVVRVQSSIDLGTSRPEPDIAWLQPGRYSARRPQPADVLLIIEVADSSLSDDLAEKASLYAQFRIAEYWVVDATGRRIHVHRRSDGDRYQEITQFSAEQTIAPTCKSSATLVLSDLFAE